MCIRQIHYHILCPTEMREEIADLTEKELDVEIIEESAETSRAQNKKPKKKKALTKLQQAQNDIKELNDKDLRRLAEFENYKKRTLRETQRALIRVEDSAVASFLPLLDDIHRTLLSAREHKADDSFISGIELIKDNFENILESRGVSAIETVGEEFDPEFHEAMLVSNDAKQKNNIILEELEKGYKHNDRVLRHAKVKVNKI